MKNRREKIKLKCNRNFIIRRDIFGILMPMSLTYEEIKKIAHLARLSFTDTELPRYTEELSRIIHTMSKMNEVDTNETLPMAHPLDIQQPLRPDVVTETNQRDLFQSIAPLVTAGLYLVPKVIE